MSDKASDKTIDKNKQATNSSDKTSDRLLNCPFCGGEAVTAEVYNAKEKKLYPAVKCLECGCRTPMMKTYDYAIEMWNTRKPMERILERLEEVYNVTHENYMKDRDLITLGKKYGLEHAIEIVKEGGINV